MCVHTYAIQMSSCHGLQDFTRSEHIARVIPEDSSKPLVVQPLVLQDAWHFLKTAALLRLASFGEAPVESTRWTNGLVSSGFKLWASLAVASLPPSRRCPSVRKRRRATYILRNYEKSCLNTRAPSIQIMKQPRG